MNMKKRILVYLGSFFPHEDAITNSVLPLLEKMKEKYEIDIYTKSIDGKDKIDEEINGYHVYRDKCFNHSSLKKTKFKLHEIRNTNLEITSSKRFFVKWIIVKILNLVSDSCWEKLMNLSSEKWFNSFQQIAYKNNYDLILTITSPIVSQYEGYKLYKKGYFNHSKWIVYFVDPFATYIRNLQHPDSDKFIEFETKVYKYANLIITSDEIKKDNLKYPMGEYDEKVYSIPFATLKFDYRKNINTGKFKCVYTGSLFDITIRNPEYFFKLISKISNNIEVIIVCNLSNSKVDKLKKEYLDNRENIKWYGRKSIVECFDLMNNADVLVNLGNECTNQTPSKVFDYIGRCKHIVNFYSIDDDTSKKYLENYPYALNIKNKKIVDANDLKKLEDFIYSSRNEEIDNKEIEKEYDSLTSENIANRFMYIINLIE